VIRPDPAEMLKLESIRKSRTEQKFGAGHKGIPVTRRERQMFRPGNIFRAMRVRTRPVSVSMP